MNRLRTAAPKTPLSVFITLAAAMAVATTGGVMHAICKNHQVLTERKIAAAETRTKEARRLDSNIAVRMDRLCERYELRDRLRANGSSMVPLGYGDIVEVSTSPSPLAVASTGKQR